LGGVAVAEKQFSDAETFLRQALGINEKLVADFPTYPVYATTLAGGYCGWAHLLQDQTQAEAALEWYAKAIRTSELVLAQDPRQADAGRFLGLAHAGRARALNQLNRDAEAGQAWERAIATYSGPGPWEYRLFRARSLARAGDHTRAIAAAEALDK